MKRVIKYNTGSTSKRKGKINRASLVFNYTVVKDRALTSYAIVAARSTSYTIVENIL